jgi:predicted amidohydrolase
LISSSSKSHGHHTRSPCAVAVSRYDESLWLDSNGSEGCYGGWELRFPVTASEGDELVFELGASASDLTRDGDALVVEAFWHGADDAQRDWDPVFFTSGYPNPRYSTRLRCPAGATELRVRCGLRWSPTGRVRFHGWRLYPVQQTPHRLLRLGVASAKPPAWKDLWTNRAHYVAQCELAGEAGLGLVVLPELILTYGMPGKDPCKAHAAAFPAQGEWLEPFQEVARRHKMGICFSAYERAGEHGEILYNTAFLLGQDGALIGTYRKVHLALGEARNGVAAGHDFPVYDFHGINVGMLICMDSTPLESTRILARKGAELMLMPIMGDFRANDWKPRGQRGYDWSEERWRLVQRAHAFDNHLYTAIARNTTAGSSVTAPWGDILAWDDGSQGLVWADIDVDDRRRHPTGSTMQSVLWSMRRPAVYSALTDAESAVAPQKHARI